jgi:hypothetical protein
MPRNFNKMGGFSMKRTIKMITCLLAAAIILSVFSMAAMAANPTAPVITKVEQYSLNGAVIEWTDNSNNETGFRVLRQLMTPLDHRREVIILPSNTTKYLDTGLTFGNTYQYTIGALGADDGYSESNRVSVSITTTIPAAPTNLTATRVTDKKVTLTWSDNADNETVYRVVVRDPSLDDFEYFDLPANSTTYEASVYPGNTFNFQVYAGNNAGESRSSIITVTTPLEPEVKAPENLRTSSVLENEVELLWWDRSDNETRFQLERQYPGRVYEQIAELAANTTSYKDTSVEPGKTYVYRIRAKSIKMAGFPTKIPITMYSDYSNEVTVTTPQAAPTKPAAPSNLRVNSVSHTEVDLAWTDNSNNETFFYLERQYPGRVYEQIAVLEANTTSYRDTDVEPNKTYIYRIRAVSIIMNRFPKPPTSMYSDYSNEVELTTPEAPLTVPAAPERLVATIKPDGKVLLAWQDKSNNETFFYIERKTANGAYAQIGSCAANTTSWTDESVQPNTTYYYKIRAVSIIMNRFPIPPRAIYSDYSNQVNVTTPDESSTPGQPDTPEQPGTTEPTEPVIVGASAWAVEEIKKAVEYGLVTDKVMKDFKGNIPRDEFCEIVVKLYEKLIHQEISQLPKNPFKDTSNKSIIKAYSVGIVKGIKPDEFAPKSPITRREICVMLFRAITGAIKQVDTDTSGVPTFSDEKLIGKWAINEVRFAFKNDIMLGIGSNTINPLGNTTRQEAILLIKRVYEKYGL